MSDDDNNIKYDKHPLGSQVMMYGIPEPTIAYGMPEPPFKPFPTPDDSSAVPETKTTTNFILNPPSPQIPDDVMWMQIDKISFTEDKVIFETEDLHDEPMDVSPQHLNEVVRIQGLTEKVLGDGLRGYFAVFALYNDEWVLLALKDPED